MRIDCHVHAVGNGRDIAAVDRDIFYNADDNPHLLVRLIQQLVERRLIDQGADLDHGGAVSTAEYLAFLTRMLASSEEIDAMVVLAMDAVFDPKDGQLDRKRTDLWAGNRCLARLLDEANANLSGQNSPKRFLLGASVNPNRTDWEKELDFVIHQTNAVLLKLIPSAQHIHLEDLKHQAFWKALAEAQLPLLCHTGPEYAFAEGRREWRLDDFRRLAAILDSGVRVIAAHCNTPVFSLFDADDFHPFVDFMHKVNSNGTVQLFADTSALTITSRIPYLAKVRDRIPAQWLVNGSDFPIPTDGWVHLPLVVPGITLSEYRRIVQTTNPLDRDVRIKRAAGFDDSILSNASQVLRLPKD